MVHQKKFRPKSAAKLFFFLLLFCKKLNEQADSVDHRLMKHINHQCVAAQECQGRNPGTIGEGREFALRGEAAEKSAAEKHKQPGENREIIRGKKGGAVNAQGHKPIRGVPGAGQMNQRDGPKAPKATIEIHGKENPGGAYCQSNPDWDFVQPFFGQSHQDHGNGKQVQDAKIDRL